MKRIKLSLPVHHSILLSTLIKHIFSYSNYRSSHAFLTADAPSTKVEEESGKHEAQVRMRVNPVGGQICPPSASKPEDRESCTKSQKQVTGFKQTPESPPLNQPTKEGEKKPSLPSPSDSSFSPEAKKPNRNTCMEPGVRHR